MNQNRNNLINSYFSHLSEDQVNQFQKLGSLYQEWNARINVISRKDIDHLLIHHILHSLSIAKIVSFKSGTRIMDAGTGGGFPGIPLAIYFPAVDFTLVDSVAKKIRVVQEVATELNLKNVRAVCSRVEAVRTTFDFITGRAVSDLGKFFSLVKNKIQRSGFNDIPNGILYLKGGELEPELSALPRGTDIYNLADYFNEEYFQTKKLIHIHNF